MNNILGAARHGEARLGKARLGTEFQNSEKKVVGEK